MQPGVVAGQIEGAGAAGNARAIADGHQPFVLDQQLTGFTILLAQLGVGGVDLTNDFVEHLDGNHRAGAVGVELLTLALQVFEQIRLQIGARSHIHDLEKRGDRKMVIDIAVALQEHIQTAQQILQPQVGAHAFVEGVLVNNHGMVGSAKGDRERLLSNHCIGDALARLAPVRTVCHSRAPNRLFAGAGGDWPAAP